MGGDATVFRGETALKTAGPDEAEVERGLLLTSLGFFYM